MNLIEERFVENENAQWKFANEGDIWDHIGKRFTLFYPKRVNGDFPKHVFDGDRKMV